MESWIRENKRQKYLTIFKIETAFLNPLLFTFPWAKKHNFYALMYKENDKN